MGTLKSELRKNILAQLRSTIGQMQSQQEALSDNLIRFLANQQGTWAAYANLPEEASVDVGVHSSPHLSWVYPRVEDSHLQFVSPLNFSKGAFGILEPVSNQTPIAVRDLNGLLIPGLMFDKKGARLGRGKGFYDRALQGSSGLKVGVAWSFQVLPQQELPREGHDIFMDVLITEDSIIEF